MKKMKNILLLVILCLIGSNLLIVEATENIVEDSTISILNRSERLELAQIDEETLSGMSTSELIEEVLDYPFLIDLYLFDSVEIGFEHIKDEFNGLEELLSRADLGETIYDSYKETPIITQSLLANDFDMFSEQYFKSMVLEDLINQAEILATLEDAELLDDFTLLQSKYEKIYEDDIYLNQESSILYSSSVLFTPNGTAVSVTNRSSYTDYTTAQKEFFHSQIKAAYPSVTLVSHGTLKYNCHSYAWYSTSTSNVYWMNSASAYVSDGSYTKTTVPSSGNKVYYSTGEHSAIVKTVGNNYVTYTSKWGEHGVYTHYSYESPYSGTQSFYK